MSREEEEEVLSLIYKHFGGPSGLEYIGDYHECRKPINWEEFLADLDRVPNMAHIMIDAEDRVCPDYIHYFVLLEPGLPLEVMQKLVDINPEAINYIFDRFNLLDTAAVWYRRRGDPTWDRYFTQDIDPDILRLLIQKSTDKKLAVNFNDGEREPAILKFLQDSRDISVQARAIMDESWHAVAVVLFAYFTGKADLSETALEFCCEAVKKDINLNNYRHTRTKLALYFDECSLLEGLFEKLTNANADRFRRILKLYVEASLHERPRNHLFGSKNPVRRPDAVHTESLTNCVLFVLAENKKKTQKNDQSYFAANKELSLEQSLKCRHWKLFVDTFPEDLGGNVEIPAAVNYASSPLFTALRLGYSWQPVLKDILNANPSALESADFVEGLPAFALSATVTCFDSLHSPMSCCICGLRGDCHICRRVSCTSCKVRCDYFRQQVDDRGLFGIGIGIYKVCPVENIYQLLRSKPDMLKEASSLLNASISQKSLADRKLAFTASVSQRRKRKYKPGTFLGQVEDVGEA